MKAAIITAFTEPPHYGDCADPVPHGPGEMLVDILGAGLHHLTRGRASGRHYSSVGSLPLVPGVDGVGRGTDGKLRYFAQRPGQSGTIAERTVIDLDHSIELPPDSDPITIAAAMNPAMASWLALRCRVPFQRGQKVLVLGATGSSGSLAVQIARYLGAAQVVAAGRNESRLATLAALGATDTVSLGDPRLGALACEVDVVLDFLWGECAVRTMEALLQQRADRRTPLTWVHVGSMAGETSPIPGAFLRSADFQIVGSGHGSVPDRDILMALPELVDAIARDSFQINVKAVPLRDVEQAWPHAAHTNGRVVFTP